MKSHNKTTSIDDPRLKKQPNTLKKLELTTLNRIIGGKTSSGVQVNGEKLVSGQGETDGTDEVDFILA